MKATMKAKDKKPSVSDITQESNLRLNCDFAFAMTMRNIRQPSSTRWLLSAGGALTWRTTNG